MRHHFIFVPTRRAVLVAAAAMFLAGPASAETTVTNIVMAPSAPAALEYDTQVNVAFDYETDEPGGVWIGFLPHTEGSRTPGLMHSGGPYYPIGSGSGSFWFTVESGPIVVDEVHVEMYDTTLALVDSIILPSTFAFVESGSITNIVMTPDTPATVDLDEQVQITFDYETPEPVLIRFQPFSSGAYTAGGQDPGYLVNAAGTGSGSTWITVTGSPIEVDALLVTMQTMEPQFLILFHLPVSYTFDETTVALPSTWGRMKTRYEPD